jgi:hypothetical protein
MEALQTNSFINSTYWFQSKDFLYYGVKELIFKIKALNLAKNVHSQLAPILSRQIFFFFMLSIMNQPGR